MLSALKKRLLSLCFEASKRSSSGEVISKTKIYPVQIQQFECNPKRPLSIDSKEKEQSSKQKLQATAKKLPNFDDLQCPPLTNKLRISSQLLSDFVSDIHSEGSDLMSGINSFQQDQGELEDTKRIIMEEKQLQFSMQECSTEISKDNSRIKYIRPKTNNMKRIQQGCSVCRRQITYKQSLQLACLHRYHKKCINNLQQSLNFKCNICQRRKKIVLQK